MWIAVFADLLSYMLFPICTYLLFKVASLTARVKGLEAVAYKTHAQMNPPRSSIVPGSIFDSPQG
jgi:hypothetical protein